MGAAPRPRILGLLVLDLTVLVLKLFPPQSEGLDQGLGQTGHHWHRLHRSPLSPGVRLRVEEIHMGGHYLVLQPLVQVQHGLGRQQPAVEKGQRLVRAEEQLLVRCRPMASVGLSRETPPTSRRQCRVANRHNEREAPEVHRRILRGLLPLWASLPRAHISSSQLAPQGGVRINIRLSCSDHPAHE